MQRRPFFWFVISLLSLAAAIYFWQLGDKWQAEKRARTQPTGALPSKNGGGGNSATVNQKSSAQSGGANSKQAASTATPSAKTRFPYRLSNTSKALKQLLGDDKAILLANALIDTTNPTRPAIPDRLRAAANSGSYVVQAGGPLDDRFRALLAGANATIVSYIPNNAYLVRVSDAGAQQISGSPLTQSVLTYEPYYKLDGASLALAMQDQPLPPNTGLNVTVFSDAYDSTMAGLKQLGAEVASQDRSPFGPVLQIHPAPGTLAEVAGLPGVQLVSLAHARVLGNDLTRPRLEVATDSIVSSNWLNLSGSNVVVNINDSGVDANHPDLAGRITADVPSNLTDSNGHGTHVAGTILGSGIESSTVTNAQGSVPGANFRGMATNATAYVLSIDSGDSYLQEQAALTNALISNNSWNYDGDNGYDIAAASYDAAVRDALPQVPGSQPVLFVFSAGNDGGGDTSGDGGSADTIASPGTAKNVITVGAIEQYRNITNLVIVDDSTNEAFLAWTDSSNQVSYFSSRGNVGIGIEGDSGRFKPDLVSPGSFVISDRSTTWDQKAYYNPTNYTFTTYSNQTVGSNMLTPYSIFLPDNTVQVVITVTSNSLSPNPFPPMPIYLSAEDNPTTNTYDFLGTNVVSLPTNTMALPLDATLFYSVGNFTTNPVINFDVQIMVATTNDTGNYLTVLSNLNNSIGGPTHYYRYESGTSMAAAGVSGTLACMQEFFQGRLKLTNSPALMKALLINGARPVSGFYDLQVASSINYQGWGLPSLPDSIPALLTNLNTTVAMGVNAPNLPLLFFDQSPTNALATGQSQTYTLGMAPAGQLQPLRVTLVWTDPPGSPAAGAKLVNNLVLAVTNLQTGDVFYGNDIATGSDFNEAWNTNGPPNIDLVNNVQNVYLSPPLGTNYSITVIGQRVNVNAVTANTNNIVQDYALVISSGDAGAVPNPFVSLIPNAMAVSPNAAVLLGVTNGVPLFNQRVGANPQFAPTTNGLEQQWNFYIYTNTPGLTNANFTNVAFITFLPPNLGVSRMGAFNEVGQPDTNATRYAGADIDLYVSGDPTLTNLNPVAVNNAVKSVGRTGSETVVFTNSTAGQVHDIGVKSEDQEAAQFGFLAVASDVPFSQTGSNGNVTVNMFPLPAVIPGGSPAAPSSVLIFGVATQPVQIRKVVVTNTVTHQDFGDLIGTLSFGQNTATLNNHSFFTNINDATETFIYDDSGENEIPGAITSAGPGTLRGFTGMSANSGAWIFAMVNDSSPSDSGQVDNISITIEPQSKTNGFFRTIPGDSWFYDYVDVPVDATNLTISVSQNTVPVDLYVDQANFPTQTSFDEELVVPIGGGALSINKFDSPPLNAGRYYYGIFNPSATPQNVFILVQVQESIAPVTPLVFLSQGNEPLLDDAVTDSTNYVGVKSTVAAAEVGVRINHPRESDLVLTLISPSGTRVLLAENRGGLDTNGYGSGVNITNVLPQTTSGTQLSETNNITITNGSGTLIIDYNFFSIPDDMQIYDGNSLLFDTGLINGAGIFQLNYGPTSSTNLSIVMNAPGTNPDTNTTDLWDYTVTVITEAMTYCTFTENTNLTTLPIKFATPPFGGSPNTTPPVTNLTSGFEGVAAGGYAAPAVVDGWTVMDANVVNVVTVPALANSGTNVLALHKGTISRVMPTVAGQSYTLTFANHGPPVMNPIGWWKGEGNGNDSSGYNNTMNVALGTVSYQPGVVGDAFDFTNTFGSKLRVDDQPIYNLTNAITMEGWMDSTMVQNSQVAFYRADNRRGNDPYGLVANLPSIAPGQPLEMDFFVTDTNNIQARVGAPFPTNQFVHVAGTYQYNSVTGSAVMTIYTNGIAAMQINTPIIPAGPLETNNGAGLGIGNVGDSINDFPFFGLLDEMTLYSNALTATQVQDIYAAGSYGKCPVGSICTATASVIFGGTTNLIVGTDGWTNNTYSFTATSANMVLEIQSDDDGMLLDSFQLVESSEQNPANYYLPEESLDKLIGESSAGNWVLEVLDNRVGATNPAPNLVSWKLNLYLNSANPAALPLQHGIPTTNTLGPNGIAYFIVDVPAWAGFATNILGNVVGGPVTLLFDQTVLPESTTNAVDYTLVANTTVGGTATLTTNGPAPLLEPGQRYYLGVTNLSTSPVTFTMEVDFNITTLTNGVPIVTNTLAVGNLPRYYQFDVDSNGVAATFETYGANGNVELVVNDGPPLPTLTAFNYGSDFPGTNNQTIIVVTNSTPVPLSAGRWYVGVYNNDIIPVTYSILAQEFTAANIIPLTNDVPYLATNVAPGMVLSNFYSFTISNMTSAALFEVYSNTGSAGLNLQFGALPYGPPFFAQGTMGPNLSEQIVIRTNNVETNLNGTWYLGVPNTSGAPINYSILAVVDNNGMLISPIPIDLSVTPPANGNGVTITYPSVTGEYYEVQFSTNLTTWSILTTNIATGPLTTYTVPLSTTPFGFYQIVQIPVP